MLKLKDVYDLQGKQLKFADWYFQAEWFPEIGNMLTYRLSSELLEQLDADGRIKVIELVNPYIDGDRVCEMHTLWFDDQPFAIHQRAGRGGTDHKARWLTDKAAYLDACKYLLGILPLDTEEDLRDPNEVVYPEEIFCFYGHDFSVQFGHALESKSMNAQVIHAHRIANVFQLGDYLALFESGQNEPPEYLRRDAFVMKLERVLGATDFGDNPQAYERVQEGVGCIGLYRECSRPDNVTVVKV